MIDVRELEVPTLTTVSEEQLAAIEGGASIYINGIYWGEGELDLRPWPTGFRVVSL
jgi:hypothetical protein